MAAREDGAWVSVVVTNQGTPIPGFALQSIFDPLVQLSKSDLASPKRRSTSMGLGLFIARQIVTAHRRTIDATSSTAHGAAFKVCVPKRLRPVRRIPAGRHAPCWFGA